MSCSECMDEGGLPVHMPLPVTEKGEGPADLEDAHHVACWCSNPKCMWNKAFKEAVEIALLNDDEYENELENDAYLGWERGAEEMFEWITNNPSPAGIPRDPPVNPYE